MLQCDHEWSCWRLEKYSCAAKNERRRSMERTDLLHVEICAWGPFVRQRLRNNFDLKFEGL